MSDFTYSYHHYEKGIFGKCNEMPALSAQAKTEDEVKSLLDNMVRKYLEVVKETKQKI